MLFINLLGDYYQFIRIQNFLCTVSNSHALYNLKAYNNNHRFSGCKFHNNNHFGVSSYLQKLPFLYQPYKSNCSLLIIRSVLFLRFVIPSLRTYNLMYQKHYFSNYTDFQIIAKINLLKYRSSIMVNNKIDIRIADVCKKFLLWNIIRLRVPELRLKTRLRVFIFCEYS